MNLISEIKPEVPHFHQIFNYFKINITLCSTYKYYNLQMNIKLEISILSYEIYIPHVYKKCPRADEGFIHVIFFSPFINILNAEGRIILDLSNDCLI